MQFFIRTLNRLFGVVSVVVEAVEVTGVEAVVVLVRPLG